MSADPSQSGPKTLERRQAARIVASRLAELGRPRDLIENDGVTALLEESHGSADRLRALLTSTLFLASTEDAGRIGPDHVHRAAASLPHDVMPGPIGGAEPRPGWRAIRVAAPATALVVVAVILLRPREISHPPQVPAMTTTPKAPPATAAPAPAAVPTRPPKPPAPAAPAHPAEAVLPETPPTSITIYAAPADPASAAQLPPILQRLRAMGLEPVLATEVAGKLSGASVGFFYEEDRAAAARVAAAVGPGIVPIRLNNHSGSTTVRPPGTIQIIVPPSRPETKP